ncbi:MAG: DNA polymerase III subunit gamma/tau [Pirellulales bacterium]
MSDSEQQVDSPETDGGQPDLEVPYVVVARRYRPQTFEELIGQEHVTKGLQGAIEAQRVGHAYLFTGVRGVGKTSAARILAKALDCEKGPGTVPCNECDICESISTGEDVDVLEIDGASNRGIDEIRQLRSNVNVRPSRARYKIYIIDEVHMLTREAFNALLKTLEEPPEHVKFIFCTTEANKIPVTVLSRCQRFDFAGISQDALVARLKQIVATEGVTADEDALQLLARRAAGSMRDSQSLLEQMLACGDEHITTTEVNRMLGTADNTLLLKMAQNIVAQDTASVLTATDGAVAEGVDIGQLLEQLVGVFRDTMVAQVGCDDGAFLFAATRDERETIHLLAKELDLETNLALIQILTQAASGLRYSMHRRPLAEIALVRACKLECLEDLASLAAQLKAGPIEGRPGAASSTKSALPKKKSEPIKAARPEAVLPQKQPEPKKTARPESVLPRSRPANPTETAVDCSSERTVANLGESDAATAGTLQPLTEQNAGQIWEEALNKLTGMITAKAKEYETISVPAPNRLMISFDETYKLCKSYCERPEPTARLRQALREVTGIDIEIVFALSEHAPKAEDLVPRPTRQQTMASLATNPLMQRASELFGARPVDVLPPKDSVPPRDIKRPK